MSTVADLGRLVKQKHPGAYDDIDDAELGARVKSKYPGAYDDFKGVTVKPRGNALDNAPTLIPGPLGGAPLVGQPMTQTAVQVLGAAPTLGGMAGGLAGGVGGTIGGLGVGGAPGAIGGAVMGGAGGEAVKQLGMRALGLGGPDTAGQAAGNIGVQGLQQGAFEAGGRVMGAGAGKVASGLMRLALSKAGPILHEFPEAVQTALGLGAPVGRWAALPWEKLAGSKVAANALGKSAENTANLVAQANAAGHMVDIKTLAQPIIDAVKQREGRAWSQAAEDQLVKSIENRANELISNRSFGQLNPGLVQLNPEEALQLKQYADRSAGAARRASKVGNPVPPISNMDKSLANVSRDYVHNLPGVGPELVKSDARTQALIGATRALSAAESKSAPMGGRYIPYTAGALSAGAGARMGMNPAEDAILGALGYGASKTVASPEVLSRLALLINSPFFRGMMQQAPRGIAAGAGQ